MYHQEKLIHDQNAYNSILSSFLMSDDTEFIELTCKWGKQPPKQVEMAFCEEPEQEDVAPVDTTKSQSTDVRRETAVVMEEEDNDSDEMEMVRVENSEAMGRNFSLNEYEFQFTPTQKFDVFHELEEIQKLQRESAHFAFDEEEPQEPIVLSESSESNVLRVQSVTIGDDSASMS